jgi:hypothetical protein
LIPAKAIESVEAEAAKPIGAKTVKVKAPVEAAGRRM